MDDEVGVIPHFFNTYCDDSAEYANFIRDSEMRTYFPRKPSSISNYFSRVRILLRSLITGGPSTEGFWRARKYCYYSLMEGHG